MRDSKRPTGWLFRSVLLAFGLALTCVLGAEPRGRELALLPTAQALPLYAARAGRSCNNCHADPTGWKDPELSRRKCNLSCSTCHVNPGGGGLRTVVGRYYGQATLPIFLATHRPHKDRQRHLPFVQRVERRGNHFWDPAVGRPPGGSAALAYDEGRYNGLRADPLFSFGVDTRYAFWIASGAALLFPMQMDLHAALHPYRHVTAYATGGVLAKSKGYGATFERETPFFIKDTFLMLHQLPYMSYLRAGRFIPTFGTSLEDHTAPTRRLFQMESGLLHSRVTGVELGMAPNYPYVALSVFRPSPQDAFSGADANNDANPPFMGVGWGSALALGWRDLGWQVGLSGMLRRRELADGGNDESLALSWAFNPWYYVYQLPLTYLGEVALGGQQRQLDGSRSARYAAMHQLDALVRNGVNLRVSYDFGDPDTKVRDDHYHRLGFGGELIFIPAVALRGDVRVRFNPGGETTTDALLQVRGWY